MVKNEQGGRRRGESLSRERIIEASIALLDQSGEGGLTFRALSRRLVTGPGAIYWHIANKGELLTAACDAIVVRALNGPLVEATPEAVIRALALGIYDAIDAHPWVGSALTHAVSQAPMVRVIERLGQQVRALGVPREAEWATASALISYILGVAVQNAAHRRHAEIQGVSRSNCLGAAATSWSHLDPDEYPFTRSVAGQFRDHDDRVDFLAGIDLILGGVESLRGR